MTSADTCEEIDKHSRAEFISRTTSSPNSDNPCSGVVGRRVGPWHVLLLWGQGEVAHPQRASCAGPLAIRRCSGHPPCPTAMRSGRPTPKPRPRSSQASVGRGVASHEAPHEVDLSAWRSAERTGEKLRGHVHRPELPSNAAGLQVASESVCRSGTTQSGRRRPGRRRTPGASPTRDRCDRRSAPSSHLLRPLGLGPRATFPIERDRRHLTVQPLRFKRKRANDRSPELGCRSTASENLSWPSQSVGSRTYGSPARMVAGATLTTPR
jgi:hypothetical protein